MQMFIVPYCTALPLLSCTPSPLCALLLFTSHSPFPIRHSAFPILYSPFTTSLFACQCRWPLFIIRQLTTCTCSDCKSLESVYQNYTAFCEFRMSAKLTKIPVLLYYTRKPLRIIGKRVYRIYYTTCNRQKMAIHIYFDVSIFIQ